MSMVTPSGVTSCAARSKPRFIECRRRLPGMPRIRKSSATIPPLDAHYGGGGPRPADPCGRPKPAAARPLSLLSPVLAQHVTRAKCSARLFALHEMGRADIGGRAYLFPLGTRCGYA